MRRPCRKRKQARCSLEEPKERFAARRAELRRIADQAAATLEADRHPAPDRQDATPEVGPYHPRLD